MRFLAALLLCAPAFALARPLPTAEIVDAAARALVDHYVFPEVGEKAAQHLRDRASTGAYATVNDPAELAQLLTDDVQAITHDKHVRVRPTQASPMAPRSGNANANSIAPSGIARAEILPGNIGYIDLRVFPPLDAVRQEMTAAMNRLADTRALIVDARGHRGGSPETVAYFCSYLFDGRVHLNSLYSRATGETTDFWTRDVPGPRFGGAKPVFVLTSDRTFSAGEELSYNLQTQRRATLIGQTTRGGANPGRAMPLPGNFSIFVSTGRAINPITRTNWEGVGVRPDVTTPAAEAFGVAYERALAGIDRTQLDATTRAAIDELLRTPPMP